MNKFTPAQQETLLKIARQAIEAGLGVGVEPDLTSDFLQQSVAGVFVTLRKQDGLRGCVGLFKDGALGGSVVEMAQAAAFSDDRFSPLEKEELDALKIEISILSPMREIKDISEIEYGRHGVYIKWCDKTGTYLPQVARDFKDKEEFLDSLCQDKLGASAKCWRDPGVKLYIYSSYSF